MQTREFVGYGLIVFLSILFIVGVEAYCAADIECDDGNVSTFDQCLNPGTNASSCRNTAINCASDNDCSGGDMFVGELFCSLNNSMQNFQNATCNNPGTLLSFCTVNVFPKIVRECLLGCVDGECLEPPIACYTDDDCDDLNASTSDKCVHPGLPESYCENELINESVGIHILSPFFGQRFGFIQIPLIFTVSGPVRECEYSVDDGSYITLPNCGEMPFEVIDAGGHSVSVKAYGELYAWAEDHVDFSVDLFAPSIDLDGPSDNVVLKSRNVELKFTATDLGEIARCEVWGDFDGEFSKDKVITEIISGEQESVAYRLQEGSYTWNVFCVDDFGHGRFAPENRTFRIELDGEGNSEHNEYETYPQEFYSYQNAANTDYEYEYDEEPTISLDSRTKQSVQYEPGFYFLIGGIVLVLFLIIVVAIVKS